MELSTGAQFKAAREKLRLTKTQLAELMKLPRPEVTGYKTVTRWEDVGPPPAAQAHMEALTDGYRPQWWDRKEREPHFHG